MEMKNVKIYDAIVNLMNTKVGGTTIQNHMKVADGLTYGHIRVKYQNFIRESENLISLRRHLYFVFDQEAHTLGLEEIASCFVDAARRLAEFIDSVTDEGEPSVVRAKARAIVNHFERKVIKAFLALPEAQQVPDACYYIEACMEHLYEAADLFTTRVGYLANCDYVELSYGLCYALYATFDILLNCAYYSGIKCGHDKIDKCVAFLREELC